MYYLIQPSENSCYKGRHQYFLSAEEINIFQMEKPEFHSGLFNLKTFLLNQTAFWQQKFPC